MDRFSRLLSTSTRQSNIIEIGAGYSPVAPKSKGWRTHVVDHADQATLRAKYQCASVDVDAIEPVDSIWREGPLHQSVPAALHGSFDTMIASHVMEHMPDLIGFLESAAHLVGPEGVIAAALPDKRFCLDFFQPLSTIGDIVEAHANRRVRHRRKTVVNHFAYAVTSDGNLGWAPTEPVQLKFIEDFSIASQVADDFSDDPSRPYEDFHAWHLTPTTCELIMLELGQMGVIDWRIESIVESGSFEFFIFLRRGVQKMQNPQFLQQRRMHLLRRQLVELHQQVEMAIPGEIARDPGPAAGRDASLERIRSLLEGQSAQLQEIDSVLRMLRRVLMPLRAAWRLATLRSLGRR